MSRSSPDMMNKASPSLFIKARPNVSGTDYGELDYGRSVRSIFHALWDGSTDIYAFVDDMTLAIGRGYRNAWYAAMQECGLSPADITLNEQRALDFEINSEFQHLIGVAQFVEKNSKANGGKWGTVTGRAEMWTNRYRQVKSMARTMACADQKLEWIYGDTKHCNDCRFLNGKVYRASQWDAANLRPGMRELECHGVRCQCQLLPTSKPLSKGRPPKLIAYLSRGRRR